MPLVTLDEDAAMDGKLDEQSILRAAREWAIRTGRDEAIAVSSASETMAALKTKLSPDEFKVLLSNLLHQYEIDGS
ncbi:hypothetical protein BIV09_23720 [Pseudomonas sp. 7SR1]|nr:hypothetical protein BIV09_23720 [Pseudomonas sp. 7SR1]